MAAVVESQGPAKIGEEGDSQVSYPLTLLYCGVCTMPVEYCEFSPEAEKCKEWLKENDPDLYDEMNQVAEGVGGMDINDKDKKRQTRGGRGKIKLPKKKNAPKKIQISRTQRNKKKYVTIVTGLATFEIDSKKAAKAFAQKFSCGSSVSGDDEISIQGDVTDDLWDFIPEKWPEIDEDSIEDLGDVKR
ncbi:density-regulated protein homolog [Exaiptasia diaphana]|uniref:Density-regulated protein n=1 Tax=Exaiptasia diaphana TaxID=2652724 RepID=A0A913XTV4_EXADI|nr:density-regulated protein homolog [Exaiptasia diaphana]KXJ29372.1 Density-regulated protein [Exaiptasia diaphana]